MNKKKEKLISFIMDKFSLSEKEATGLILSGNVLVNEQVITKTGVDIDIESSIRIKRKDKYVSRGSHKLLTAFDAFSINVSGMVCLDVGSSSGGFTQVLLERGAKKVYAVDCGKNQLDYSLRNDPRIISLEGTKILDLSTCDFSEKIDLSVMDVSFCSSVPIISHLYSKLDVKNIIVLIKPQFEYIRLISLLDLPRDFDGVLKDDVVRDRIVEHIKEEILKLGILVNNLVPSKIKGAKGNLEYLFDLRGE